MLFKNLRAGDEVILASAKGRGFTYTLATVEAVKSALVIVDGFKFNLKDGRGRTTPHHILPNTADTRREHLNEENDEEPAAPAAPDESSAEGKLRAIALDAIRIIRAEKPENDDDILELLGVETLASFRRQWRKLHATGP